MAAEGRQNGVGSVAAISTSTPVTPSNAIRNKVTSKKAIELNIVSVPPKHAKARPLNSWMAFRSFYREIFSGVQQKHASTYLNVLWQQDPFKAKWAVLAKTYTMIRDKVGKNMAPLDTFLKLTCPKIGIIAASDYLKMLNWAVTYEDKALSIAQIGRPNLSALEPTIVSCSMSHIDLLQYVIDSDYLNEVDDFTQDVRDSRVHMLVSAAIKFPHKAQEAFMTAIQEDPKAIAAAIFGIDINHKFLEISTRPSTMPLLEFQEPFLGADTDLITVSELLPLPQESAPMMAQYDWTGSMAELYKPSEITLDFEAMMAGDEWMVTDITNPVEMDNFLETAGGFTPDELYAGQLGEPTNMIYHFNDSF